ncbi:MAG: precorrin-3B C(17)-methyltransferase [Sphingobacteriia bacterium]|nr:precorrin-3B C(17)-methyltransferase [Sphingobacteriia bacterium]NCC37834.1 precorrin-3B C(17)-methyltransferase [Gammaproteobacteria bacterium]
MGSRRARGRLYLVGIGPGALSEMTERARAAIAAADVVIGYRTYLRLIADLLGTQEVIAREMAEELDRCAEALALARSGRTVALVSSGDVGIFGMAGPLYELLLEQGWTPGEDPEVEVIPGVTAASACAALVGAPLTHDFCAISLSDLLTPWPVIARRLESAARGDFVIALYNPKSSRRPAQLLAARDLLLRHRDPLTPVAVVRAAFRPRQDARITTLAALADAEIGMLTQLIIGNASTRAQSGLMVTPRGYALKYRLADGRARPGEQARGSLSSGLEGWRRRLIEQALASGIEDAATRLGAAAGEILEVLESAPIAPWSVRREAHAWPLLESTLRQPGARLVVGTPAGARIEARLAAVTCVSTPQRLHIQAPGWQLELPRAAVQRAYRVVLPSGESTWFQDGAGETLLWIA